MHNPRLSVSLAELLGWIAVVALWLTALALCGWNVKAWVIITGVGFWVIAPYLDQRFSLHFPNRIALFILLALILAGILLGMLFPAVR
jgi:hypothetical protein